MVKKRAMDWPPKNTKCAKKSLRFFAYFCGQLFLAVLLTSCTYRVARDPAILVRALPSDPQTLNPITATDAYQGIVNQFVTESLLERKFANMDLQPVLATRWEVAADHQHYTFFLRHDVRWHDGHPFTAADVVYSFDRINDPEVGAANLSSYFQKSGIVHAEALDDYTVRFDMDRPYVFALEVIGSMPLVPKHIFDNGTPFRANPAARVPIGTGPMKFESWVTGRSITLTRNDQYWGKPMQFAGIRFLIIPETRVAFQAMKKGQLDFSGMQPIQWERQTSGAAFTARFEKSRYLPYSNGYSYIGWNLRHPILRERRVRQALSMLIPRQKMLDAIMLGQAEIVTGPFYPKGPQQDPHIAPCPFDPTFAAQLLDSSGWIDHDGDGVRDKDGVSFHLTMLYPGPSRMADALMNILREEFHKVGIVLEARRMEWTVFVKTMEDRKFDAYIGGWTGDYESDPYQIWHSSQIEKGSNYVGFSNVEADHIMESAREEFDPDKRAKLYQRMHRILHDEQPYAFLFMPYSLSAVHHRLTNVAIYPAGHDIREWGIGPSEKLWQ